MQDGHAIERRSVPCGIDNGAHRRSNLLIAIGHGHDLRPIEIDHVQGVPVAGVGASGGALDAPYRAVDLGVCFCITSGPG